MNVTEKIREAIRLHRTVPGQSAQDVGRCVTCDVPAMYWHAAEAVVAAVRAMTPAEQADLIGGAVEWGVRHAQGIREEPSEVLAREWATRTAQQYQASHHRSRFPVRVMARVASAWREVEP